MQIHQSRKACLLLARSIHAALARFVAGAADLPPQRASDFEQLLGHPMPGIGSLMWSTMEPPKSNSVVYRVVPAQFSTNRITELARTLGVKGEIATTEVSPGIPGYWIKEPNPTNSHTWRAVVWSREGLLAYYSGDDGYRWDAVTKTPAVHSVPTAEEAAQKAISLLPALGLTTNNIEFSSDGVRRMFGKHTTGYPTRAPSNAEKS